MGIDNIKKHWRGEEDLFFAFWVNVVCILLISILIISLLCVFSIYLILAVSPKIGALLLLSTYLFAIGIIVWQMGGLWRSANHYIQLTKSRLWGTLSKAFVVIVISISIIVLIEQFPMIKDLLSIIFVGHR